MYTCVQYHVYIPPAHFLSLRVSVTATITAKMSPVKKRETPAAISPILEPLSDSEEEADIVEKQNNTGSSNLYMYSTL